MTPSRRTFLSILRKLVLYHRDCPLDANHGYTLLKRQWVMTTLRPGNIVIKMVSCDSKSKNWVSPGILSHKHPINDSKKNQSETFLVKSCRQFEQRVIHPGWCSTIHIPCRNQSKSRFQQVRRSLGFHPGNTHPWFLRPSFVRHIALTS